MGVLLLLSARRITRRLAARRPGLPSFRMKMKRVKCVCSCDRVRAPCSSCATRVGVKTQTTVVQRETEKFSQSASCHLVVRFRFCGLSCSVQFFVRVFLKVTAVVVVSTSQWTARSCRICTSEIITCRVLGESKTWQGSVQWEQDLLLCPFHVE